MPVEGQTVWLKVVPHFFIHEGALLALMGGARVPTLLGHDGGRMLLAEIIGEDLYAAELPLLRDMVNLLVELQRLWVTEWWNCWPWDCQIGAGPRSVLR